jgi:hypothetical protein
VGGVLDIHAISVLPGAQDVRACSPHSDDTTTASERSADTLSSDAMESAFARAKKPCVRASRGVRWSRETKGHDGLRLSSHVLDTLVWEAFAHDNAFPAANAHSLASEVAAEKTGDMVVVLPRMDGSLQWQALSLLCRMAALFTGHTAGTCRVTVGVDDAATSPVCRVTGNLRRDDAVAFVNAVRQLQGDAQGLVSQLRGLVARKKEAAAAKAAAREKAAQQQVKQVQRASQPSCTTMLGFNLRIEVPDGSSPGYGCRLGAGCPETPRTEAAQRAAEEEEAVQEAEEAEAEAEAARRTIPVLPGGGGTAAQLAPEHLPRLLHFYRLVCVCTGWVCEL